MDVKAEDEKGTKYDVEMQIVGHDDYGQRTLFYWAKSFAGQIKESGRYSKLHKTIVINIVDFEFFTSETKKKRGRKKAKENEPKDTRYHRELVVKDSITNEFYKQFGYFSIHFIHFVELPKFDDSTGIKTTLERWITFLNRARDLSGDTLPDGLDSEEIKKAVAELEKMSFNEKEQEYYENYMKAVMDERSRLETATRKGLERGLEQGLEQGIKKGIEQGIKTGMEKGKEEGIKAGIEKTVLGFLQQNVDDTIILAATGLTQSELATIKSKHNL